MMFNNLLSRLTKIALLMLFSSLASITLNASHKIMPLGDSTTWDWYYNDSRTDEERSGYRNHLWYELQNEGYDVNFVGSRSNGGASVSTSTGANFTNTSLWLNDFGYDQGWKVDFSPYQVQQ